MWPLNSLELWCTCPLAEVFSKRIVPGVNFILLRLFSLASLYLLTALFEQNEGVFIKLGCQ